VRGLLSDDSRSPKRPRRRRIVIEEEEEGNGSALTESSSVPSNVTSFYAPLTPAISFGDEEVENEYEVERIVDKRANVNGVQYLIKWAGWPESENTWESIDHLSNSAELVKEFDHSRSEFLASYRRSFTAAVVDTPVSAAGIDVSAVPTVPHSSPVPMTIHSNVDRCRVSRAQSVIVPRRLINVGLSCWFNALLQTILAVTPLSTALIDVRSIIPTDKQELSLIWSIGQCLKFDHSHHLKFCLSKVRRQWSDLRMNQQHDAQEVLRRILHRIIDEIDKWGGYSATSGMYVSTAEL
jgi:hypothetical protein